jgi:hypothetical protein
MGRTPWFAPNGHKPRCRVRKSQLLEVVAHGLDLHLRKLLCNQQSVLFSILDESDHVSLSPAMASRPRIEHAVVRSA